MSKLVSSHGSSSSMTTHSTPIDHFHRDLEERSSGSSGRAQLRVLSDKGLNPPGVDRLVDLALWLQSPCWTSNETLVQINRLASSQREYVAVVVVALRPQLEDYLERASRHQSRAAQFSNFSTGVLTAIDDLARVPVIWRRDDFVKRTLSETRRAEREVATSPLGDRLPHENLLPALKSDDADDDTRWNALGLALSLRLITWTDFALVELTQTGELSMAEVAQALGLSYDTINKRRQRTEQRIRELIESGKVA